MTSDSEPPTAPEQSSNVSSTTDSGFGSPAGMVTLGATVLVGTYVIFGLLLNDYWVSWIAMLLAISALLLSRVDTAFIENVAPMAVLTKVIGYLLAIIGVLAIVEDLRFADGTLNEFPDVIGALAAYAGYVLAFLGARTIKT